jgi:hypothetical protein
VVLWYAAAWQLMQAAEVSEKLLLTWQPAQGTDVA